MTRYINAKNLVGESFEFSVDSDGLICSIEDGQRQIDLGGRLTLPAYIESHAHILPCGLDRLRLDLSRCSSKADVLDAIRDALPNGEGWLHAIQYDQTKFAGAEHLTRLDLDPLGSGRPILLRHSNGHAGVANSLALEIAKVARDTPNPRGGTYLRDSNGEPNGVLLEHALEVVTNAAPMPEEDEMVEAILSAGEIMASDGITTATDMMTGRWSLLREANAYRRATNMGCKVRIRLYAQWSAVFGSRGLGPSFLEQFNRAAGPDCRFCGVKLFSDGAIGSATAAISSKYATTGESGNLIYPPDLLKTRVARAHDAGLKVAVHAIGDRALDVVIDAFEATGDASRHRIEHAMLASDEQIGRIKSLGCHVSMQPEFLIRFGHGYRAQIPDRAPNLIRVRSFLEHGVRLSFSSDRPIVKGSPTDGVLTAVSRPQGFSEQENIQLADAVHLYTHCGNDANDEPITIGGFENGSTADFQVWEAPLARGAHPSSVFRLGKSIVQGQQSR